MTRTLLTRLWADRRRYTYAAQLAIFRKCPEALSTILKKGGSVLLACKILALSRHLHTKISLDSAAIRYLDTIRSRLGILRQKLLASINRRLASSSIEADGLIDAMCAYALATSSSCADILRHFHHIRLDALSAALKKAEVQSSDALYSLELWTRTLRDTKSIFPRQLASALVKLKAHPLIKDVAVRSITDFDLDLHEDWIGDDIRNFVPYVRHDDLTVASAAQMLALWAPSALQVMLAGVNNFIVSIDDPNTIISLRRDSLQSWFANYTFVIGITRIEVLDAFRKVFQKRLMSLVQSHCETMSDVESLVKETISQWDIDGNKKPIPPLWSEKIASMEVSRGVESFTEALTTSVYGKTESVLATIARYQHWREQVEKLRQAISALENIKWDDDEIDSDDDEEDDSQGTRQKLLSEDDPAALNHHLNESLEQSFLSLQGSIGAVTKEIERSNEAGDKAAYLLRIIREIKQRLPSGLRNTKLDFPYASTLHCIIATPIVERVLTSNKLAVFKAMSRSKVPGRALWDGSPELPVLPSPWTFTILRTIELELGNLGFDLWTSPAVDELKSLLRTGLVDVISKSVPQEETTSQVNGSMTESSTPLDSSPSALRDVSIQRLFDIEYIDAATFISFLHHSADDPFSQCRNDLRQKLALTNVLDERIRKAAADYWKRTGLLFALLSQDQTLVMTKNRR